MVECNIGWVDLGEYCNCALFTHWWNTHQLNWNAEKKTTEERTFRVNCIVTLLNALLRTLKVKQNNSNLAKKYEILLRKAQSLPNHSNWVYTHLHEFYILCLYVSEGNWGAANIQLGHIQTTQSDLEMRL